MGWMREGGTRQLQALLERIHAGKIGRDQLDAFMHAPDGPILTDEVVDFALVPNVIMEPTGVRAQRGCGILCEGYGRDERYVVAERTGTHADWHLHFLWTRFHGCASERSGCFVGMFNGLPLWHDLHLDGRLSLFLGPHLFLERLGIFRHVLRNGTGMLLAPDGRLFLWVTRLDAPVGWHEAVELKPDGSLGRFGPACEFDAYRLCLDHEGRLIVMKFLGPGQEAHDFVDAFTGEVLGAKFAARGTFLGFRVTDAETCAVGRSYDGCVPFAVHLTGSDLHESPILPRGEILGHRRLIHGPSCLPRADAWKVAFDGRQTYAVGNKLQRPRFDFVSELSEEKDGWFYWGLTGRYLFKTKLITD